MKEIDFEEYTRQFLITFHKNYESFIVYNPPHHIMQTLLLF